MCIQFFYNMDETETEEITLTTFLGTYLDQGLTCDCHVVHVNTKLWSQINAVRHLSKYFLTGTLWINPPTSLLRTNSTEWKYSNFYLIFRLEAKGIWTIVKLQLKKLCRPALKNVNMYLASILEICLSYWNIYLWITVPVTTKSCPWKWDATTSPKHWIL